MSLTKKELKKLSKNLPAGSIERISRKRKISQDYVRRILRGERIRLDVIQDAIEIASTEKSKIEKLHTAINQL